MNWAIAVALGWAGYASVAHLHALRLQRLLAELCEQLRPRHGGPVGFGRPLVVDGDRRGAPRDYDG